MTDDEVIDIALAFLYEQRYRNFSMLNNYLRMKSAYEANQYVTIKSKLESRNLAEKVESTTSETDVWHIKPHGIDIIEEHSSWLSYLKSEKEKAERESQQKELQFRKLKLDVELGEKVVADYPETKQRAKDAIKYSRISMLIAVSMPLLLLLIRWIYKMLRVLEFLI